MPTPARNTTRKNKKPAKQFTPTLHPILERPGPIVPGSRFTIVNERRVPYNKLPPFFKRGGKRGRKTRKL